MTTTTIRTSAEIQAEIASIVAKDRAYNRVVNEGGEGYERNSVPSALVDECVAAKKAEFGAEWTLETLAVRRDAWNAGVAGLVKKHGQKVPQSAVWNLRNSLGFGIAEISDAKKLHNIA